MGRGALSVMKHIRQPNPSRCCGQCCVAMAANVSLKEAKQAIGKRASTNTKVLIKGLKALGVRCSSGRLKPIFGNMAKLPLTAILKIKIRGRLSGWHWVLKHENKIYDPSNGVVVLSDYYANPRFTVSSYLEIFEINK